MLETYKRLGFQGGIDQSAISCRANPDSFYDLFNFKHSLAVKGRIEQTGYFVSTQRTQGTYWDGAASATEPTTSAIRGVDTSFLVTDYVIWKSLTQLQVFYQTAYPATETINTCCLLVINNVAGLGINLGSTVDIVIDGAATFKWRKNAGGYTLAVPITTTGVSIDGGNATVYFLTAAGFTVNDTWSWKRTDTSYDVLANCEFRPIEFFRYSDRLYFMSGDNRSMVVKLAGATYYVISVGYRPVYGRTMVWFEDHLVVGGYSTTAITSSTRSRIVGWSDNLDQDNFFATDTNEADQKALAAPVILDTSSVVGTAQAVIGVFVLNQQLFVLTSAWLYVTSYLGLPLVFDFNPFLPLRTAGGNTNPIVLAPGGVFILGNAQISFFNGGSLEPISVPVETLTGYETLSTITKYGSYDAYSQELIIVFGRVLLCWQRKWNAWYRRSADFGSNSPSVTSILTVDGYLYLGIASRTFLIDAPNSWTSSTPVFDAGAGASFATPKITSHVIDANLATIKEFAGTYLAAAADTTVYGYTIDITKYSRGANVQFKLYWYPSTDGRISGNPLTNSDATYVNSASDGMLSYPRVPVRGLALEVQVVGLDGSKPPAGAVITGIYPILSTPHDQVKR